MRTVIHEMRNQLAIAVANVEAFIDGKLELTPRRLQAVLQALGEVDVLINDLRSEAPPLKMTSEPRPMNVCKIISNEVLAVEATANARGVALNVDQCPQTHARCHAFSGDPGRISQVVTNLLLNAVHYTPPRGTISVDCHRESENLTFRVANDGAGISAIDRERIFEPGFRCAASAASPGSGMGLTVARNIVTDHGGTIDVESSDGRGAVFTVRLPALSEPPAPSAGESDAASGVAIRVLD